MKIAPKYLPFASPRGGEFEDLVQEGYLGLYSAIKNYNPYVGFRSSDLKKVKEIIKIN